MLIGETVTEAGGGFVGSSYFSQYAGGGTFTVDAISQQVATTGSVSGVEVATTPVFANGSISVIYTVPEPSSSALLGLAATARAADGYKSEIEPLLVEYCFDSHGDGSHEGDFRMDAFTDLNTHLGDTQHWLPVWRNLRSQIMPPSDEAQPNSADKQKLLSWIESTVFKLDPDNPDPGRVTIRRLNRNEYRYAVYDLLGVVYDTTEAFPPDDSGYGFDNNGDVLSTSPLLMEKYITVAEEIVGLALPDDASAQVPRVDFRPMISRTRPSHRPGSRFRTPRSSNSKYR